MAKEHHYSTQLNWTGNRGDGTTDYRAYDRDHVLVRDSKDRDGTTLSFSAKAWAVFTGALK